MRKTIITVAGRTAAGKSLIAKKLAERLGLEVLKSYTTRAPRPDEIADPEHADHIFVSEKEFDELKDIAAETKINGIRYCTTMEVLNKSDFYVIDPDGIDYLKKHHGMDFHIVQFYIYADENIREKRFLERGRTAVDFQQRCSSENEQFDKYEDSHGYDIIIFNNGDIDYAINVMESYVKPIMESELEARKNMEEEAMEPAVNTEKIEEKQTVCNIDTDDLDTNPIAAHSNEISNLVPKEETAVASSADNIDFYIPDELIDNNDTQNEESKPNMPSDGASANEKTSASTMDTSCKSDKKTEEINNETASTESLNANSNMNKELDANCDKSYEGEDEDESMEAILLD